MFIHTLKIIISNLSTQLKTLSFELHFLLLKYLYKESQRTKNLHFLSSITFQIQSKLWFYKLQSILSHFHLNPFQETVFSLKIWPFSPLLCYPNLFYPVLITSSIWVTKGAHWVFLVPKLGQKPFMLLCLKLLSCGLGEFVYFMLYWKLV